MRGIYTSVNKIRRQVFTEVAKLAYEGGDYKRIEDLPYKIIPGEIASYRDSVFLERAIVGERLRLTMGLPIRKANEHAPIADGIEECTKPEKYYEPPLINVIKFACPPARTTRSKSLTSARMPCPPAGKSVPRALFLK